MHGNTNAKKNPSSVNLHGTHRTTGQCTVYTLHAMHDAKNRRGAIN
jgi:hypothetical protein